MYYADDGAFPEWLRRAVSLTLTLLGALLYAVVLGSAIIRTFREPNPTFSQGMVRMASLLSGLVGSVVAAGFARGRQPDSVPITVEHPLGRGRAQTSWQSLEPPSLARVKFMGLATFIGARSARAGPWQQSEDQSDLEPGRGWSLSMWIALLYFGLYFVIGASALVLTLTRDSTPDFLVNAAYIWLGTVVSSGYSYFGLSSQPSTGVAQPVLLDRG